MPAVGTELSLVIGMLAVAVQLLPSVTVTVYVPGAIITSSALEPTTVVPLLQEYDAPPVAVTVIDVVVQVNWVAPPELFVMFATVAGWIVTCVVAGNGLQPPVAVIV